MPYSNNLGNSSISPSLITNRFKEATPSKKEDTKSEKGEFAKTLAKVNKSKALEATNKVINNPNHISSDSNNELNKGAEILKGIEILENNSHKSGTNFASSKTSKENELVQLSQEFEKTMFKSLWNSAFNANEINDPEFAGGFGEQLMKTELVNAWVEASYKPGALHEQIYNQLKTSAETKK